jgi:hypothetical protein
MQAVAAKDSPRREPQRRRIGGLQFAFIPVGETPTLRRVAPIIDRLDEEGLLP